MKANILTSGSDTDYGTEEFRLPSFSGRWPHSTGSITTCRNPQASQGFGDFFLPRFGIRTYPQGETSHVRSAQLHWESSDNRVDRWRKATGGFLKHLLGAHQHASFSQVPHLQEACDTERRKANARGETKVSAQFISEPEATRHLRRTSSKSLRTPWNDLRGSLPWSPYSITL